MQRNEDKLDFDVDFGDDGLNNEQLGSDMQSPVSGGDEDFDFTFDDDEQPVASEDTTYYSESEQPQEEQYQESSYNAEQNEMTQEIDYGQPAPNDGQPVADDVMSMEHTEDQQEQATKLTKKQKKQQDKLNKQQVKVVEPEKPRELQNLVLYCIVDKVLPGMLGYFRNYGLNVSRIFTSIDEARDAILMQVEPCRIIIMDTGTGRFSLMGSRKAIIDLMGISDVDNKISVFYTDSVIKSDVSISEEGEGKQIEWYKYRSTADVLAVSLQKKKNENYVFDMEANDEYHPVDSLDIKGLAANCPESMNLGMPTISVDEVALNRDDNERSSQLQAYEVKY